MSKTIVHLSVPAVQTEYDILIPTDQRIDALIAVLNDSIRKMSNGHYLPSGQEQMVNPETNALLDPRRILGEYDICDGDHLVLI